MDYFALQIVLFTLGYLHYSSSFSLSRYERGKEIFIFNIRTHWTDLVVRSHNS